MPQLRHGVVGVLATIRGDRHCAAGRVVQVYLRRGSVHHVVPDPSHLAHGAREVGRKQLLAAPLLADVPQGASRQPLAMPQYAAFDSRARVCVSVSVWMRARLTMGNIVLTVHACHDVGSCQIAVLLVIVVGVVATFTLWVVDGNGSAAIVVFSCCYLVVFVACLLTAVSKQFHTTGLLRYYSPKVGWNAVLVSTGCTKSRVPLYPYSGAASGGDRPPYRWNLQPQLAGPADAAGTGTWLPVGRGCSDVSGARVPGHPCMWRV